MSSARSIAIVLRALAIMGLHGLHTYQPSSLHDSVLMYQRTEMGRTSLSFSAPPSKILIMHSSKFCVPNSFCKVAWLAVSLALWAPCLPCHNPTVSLIETQRSASIGACRQCGWKSKIWLMNQGLVCRKWGWNKPVRRSERWRRSWQRTCELWKSWTRWSPARVEWTDPPSISARLPHCLRRW